MLEFGQDISFVALVITKMIWELHLGGKFMPWLLVAPWPKLYFGQDISFVALVVIEVISDLHLSWKLVPRTIQTTSPKYRERLFSSVTKSNIEM